MDSYLLGSSLHGISQARILERLAISYSRNLPDPGIEPTSLEAPTLGGELFTTEPPGKPYNSIIVVVRLVAKSCLKLLDPMDCSPQAPLSTGTSQARILE